MNWFEGIVVYAVIWWLVIFAVLPWGVRIPDKVEPGFATSAPEHPRLWMKAGVTTVVSAVLWIIADLIISSNLISFR